MIQKDVVFLTLYRNHQNSSWLYAEVPESSLALARLLTDKDNSEHTDGLSDPSAESVTLKAVAEEGQGKVFLKQ